MKKILLLTFTITLAFTNIKAQPSPQGIYDIKGEASIYKMPEGLFIKNYESDYPIPNDGSFTLYSSSYVYLTIETDTEINLKAMDVAGEFFIKVNEGINASLIIHPDDENLYNAAIKAGRLEIIGPGTLEISDESSTRDYGMLVENSITIDGGHSLYLPTAAKNGIKAGSFIKLANGVTLNVTSEFVGMYSTSHIMIENKAAIEVNGYNPNGTGILLEGDDTGIFLFGNINSEEDKINLVVTSEQDCAIKIDGKGNIIAKGKFLNETDGWTTTLTASGVTGGIYLTGNGYVKADGAFIQGTRHYADGTISAVNAPKSLSAINQGKIEEIYKNANLTIAGPYNITKINPAIGNNINDITSYQWSPAANVRALSSGLIGLGSFSNVTLTAVRSNINNKEYTKVDSIDIDTKSTHTITLEDNTISTPVFKIYWFDSYGENYFLNNFGEENIDLYIERYSYDACDINTVDAPSNLIINPVDYLNNTPIPANCTNFNYKKSVYPASSFEMTGNNHTIIIFLEQ